MTFLDGLFIDISQKRNIDQETIKLIIGFMKTHQYDTDAFRSDLNTNNNEESNLYRVCNENMEFVSTSNQFITNIDCMFYVHYLIICII